MHARVHVLTDTKTGINRETPSYSLSHTHRHTHTYMHTDTYRLTHTHTKAPAWINVFGSTISFITVGGLL